MAPAQETADWPHNTPYFVPRRNRQPEEIDQYVEIYNRLTIREGARHKVYEEVCRWRSKKQYMKLLGRGTKAAWRTLLRDFFNKFGKRFFGNGRLAPDSINRKHRNVSKPAQPASMYAIVAEATQTLWDTDHEEVIEQMTPVVDELFTHMQGLIYRPLIMDQHGNVAPAFETLQSPSRKRSRSQSNVPGSALKKRKLQPPVDVGNHISAGTIPGYAPTDEDVTNIRNRLSNLEALVSHLGHVMEDKYQLPSSATETLQRGKRQLGEPPTELFTAKNPEHIKEQKQKSPCADNHKQIATTDREGSVLTDPGEDVSGSSEADDATTHTATPSMPDSDSDSPLPTSEALADRMMRYVEYARKCDLESYTSFTQKLQEELRVAVEKGVDSHEQDSTIREDSSQDASESAIAGELEN